MSGCTGFTPELLTGGNERERIVDEVLRRGRIYSIRAEEEATLIALLDDPDPEIRLTVLKIMEANPSPRIYDAVLYATLDESDEVTDEAYRILLENWEEARNSVLRGLNSSSVSILLSSVNVIGRRESPEDVSYLLTLFSDERDVIRSSASRGYARLGTYEDPWFQSLLTHENPLSRLSAVETLPRFRNPDLIPALIPFIRDPDPDISKAALFGLAEFDTRALPFLHETLRFSEDDELRIRILQIVEGISDASSVPVLVRLMGDGNDRISLKAVEILLGLGADVVLPILIEQVDLMDQQALLQSLILAGRFQDISILPLVFSYIDDEDGAIRNQAIETVYAFGPEASPYLLSQLEQNNSSRIISLEILLAMREPQLLYDSDTGRYMADNIFLMFEETPQEEILRYLSDVSLPSRVVSSLWSLYDIETNTDLYQKSRNSVGYDLYPYFSYYREWEQNRLSAEESRQAAYVYMQEFFETEEEIWLRESRILRDTAELYKQGAERSYRRAINAAPDAQEEEVLLLDNYLESRRSLVNRWRTMGSDTLDLARLIFLRYSLDIEALSDEYDFFRSLPRREIPSLGDL